MNDDNQRKFTVASLFTGLGGLDLGFQWEGYEIIWASDLSKHATESYKINFGADALCADVNELPFSEIPSADIIIGGPPCQSFSLMGKREPDDPRGKLGFRFLEIVEAKLPMAFVMENVPGMAASHMEGKPLPEYFKQKFEHLGYKVRLLKLVATDYLVPQIRKRLVLVGTHDVLPSTPNKMLFAQECYGIDLKTHDLGARAAISDLGECARKGERAYYRTEPLSKFAQIMRCNGLTDVSLHELPRMSKTDQLLVEHIPPGGNYRDIPDDIAPGRVMKYKQTGGRTTTYGRLHPDRPAYTINTYFRRPNVGCNFHFSESRLITPREAMRFQSIPDHFEIIYSSQDERNTFIGNAVPPLMARAIAWSLKKDLIGENTEESNIAESHQLPLL